jgi:uncharacterized protein YxjI
VNEFSDYCFCSTWDGDGEIYNRENKVVWRFKTTDLRESMASTDEIRSPVFAFEDADGRELVAIARERRFPLGRFVVAAKGLRLCTIRQRSIWFTKYELEFDSKRKWKLSMPMFSVRGKAISDDAEDILVQARTRRQWFVRIGKGIDTVPMMAALTYIIRKKLQRT